MRNMNETATMSAGNIDAARSPVRIAPPDDAAVPAAIYTSDTLPVIHGPSEHPMSPASARKAKRAGLVIVPYSEDVMLRTPGHISDTPSPHSEHPMSDSTAEPENTVSI